MSGLSGQPFFYFGHHLPNIRIAGGLLESSFSPIFTFTVDTILVLLDLLTYLLTQSPSNLSHYAIPPRPQLHSSPVPSFHNFLTSSLSCTSSSCPLWSDPTSASKLNKIFPSGPFSQPLRPTIQSRPISALLSLHNPAGPPHRVSRVVSRVTFSVVRKKQKKNGGGGRVHYRPLAPPSPPCEYPAFISFSLSFYGIVWNTSNLDVPCLASGCGPCNVMYVCVSYVCNPGKGTCVTCDMLHAASQSSSSLRAPSECECVSISVSGHGVCWGNSRA